MSEAKCTEMNIHVGGGGKVAIVDYGKLSSEYSVSVSQRYAIPDDWTEDQVTSWRAAKLIELRDIVDPIVQTEQDERLQHANWN